MKICFPTLPSFLVVCLILCVVSDAENGYYSKNNDHGARLQPGQALSNWESLCKWQLLPPLKLNAAVRFISSWLLSLSELVSGVLLVTYWTLLNNDVVYTFYLILVFTYMFSVFYILYVLVGLYCHVNVILAIVYCLFMYTYMYIQFLVWLEKIYID